MWANVLYYCLHKFHILPHEIMRLPEYEQAFIFAAVAIKLRKEQEEVKKLKARKGRRR